LMYVPAETAGNAEDVLILVDKGEVSWEVQLIQYWMLW
jgi:hypothetical protein